MTDMERSEMEVVPWVRSNPIGASLMRHIEKKNKCLPHFCYIIYKKIFVGANIEIY